MNEKHIRKGAHPIVKSVLKGVHGLLHLVADMERRGVSEEVQEGEIRGKTRDGKDVHVKYGYKVKVGLDDVEIEKVCIPLGFMGGSVSDAVFLNKHIIVDVVDKDVDPVSVLSAKSYLAIPLVAKTSRICQEFHQCGITECPAYDGLNPCCWSIFGSCMRHKTETEDDRRQACMECDLFKSAGVLWMDKPDSNTLVTSDQMTTLTTLSYQAGIIIDNFQMYQALENANASLKEINERLAEVNRDLSIAQARINKDLDQARVIQTGLLPTEFTNTKEVTVGAQYLPASQVGGDYYDIVSESLSFIIGIKCFRNFPAQSEAVSFLPKFPCFRKDL